MSMASLRDWFAGQALAGMVSDSETVLIHHSIAKETDESGETSHRQITAEFAYQYADAMLAARGDQS